ncbi:MAG: hypothetical protein FWD49_07670, partial [Firmicutes bacterium]|nr:hypothetical protein [Bacillota bacterium]
NETDLSRLYDADKRQFYLGYNAKENIYEGHYDLLASESRLTSFIYSAMQNDPSHWKALIRDFSGEHGNTLLSWSGTMFEYLMPELFLITPKNSLCGISCKNAVKVQSRIKTGGVFGLSESGYYAFDDSLRYQYRAFGADKLALGRDKQKNVISPYSSVLSLEYAKRKSLKNLKKLSEIGAQGEYGFYEAVDMDGGARVVYSYMTHHQGMILASIANILTGGKIKEFMFKNSALRGGAILLTEPQNRGAHGYKAEIKEKDALKKGYEYFKSFNKLERICTGAGVTGGGISAYADSFGSGYTLFNGTYINRYARGSIGGAGGRHFYVKKDNDFVSPCFATMKDDLKNYSFHYTPSVITHQNNKGGVRLEITVDPYLQAEVLRLSAEGGGKKEIAFYEAIALADYGKQNAHPAFNGMFLSSEYDKDLNAVIIKRSLRKGEKPIYTALVVRGVENTVYETNRFNFLGRCRSENSPQFLDNETYENETKNISFGDILEPCFAFKGEMVDESCEVIKLFAESRETLIQNILKIPTDYFGFASESGGAHGISELANAMLYPLNSGAYNEKLLQDIDSKGKRDCFMKFTSGKKVLIYELGASQNLSPIKHIANAVNDLRQFDLYPKVVIILESNASSHRISYVEKLFKKHQVHATVLTPESLGEASADYAFLNLNNICAEVTHFYKNHMNDSGFSYENAELQSGDKIMPSPDMNAFKSGEGIFTTGVYRLPLRVKPLLPHSNVVALSEGGFIATENGGGLIFGANSYESRITRHDNDPVKDTPYERIFLEKNGRRSRINGGSRTNEVLYSRGRIRYLSTAGGKDNMLESYMVFNGKVKINEVKFWDQDSLIYCAEFILGTETGSPFIYAERVAEHMFKVKNMLSYQESFIRILGKHICESEIVQNGAEIEILAKLNICEADRGAKNIYIAIGSHNEISELSEEIILTKKAESLKYFNDLSPIKISTKDLSLNALFNDWLPYQVVSSRLNGRCGYYQLGGAIGYRDQLQDALALMQWDAPRVKKQILLHAEHQYSEGDVQHWWHPPAMGLRSKISDDKLFLPYVVAEYITATGDKNILEEAVPFLVSPPLGTHEHARYESPKITEEKFTIREHCARAIKSALKYGKHGLLLMGTGDWNDGLDFIGENGIGESVPLTMFCYETIVKYSKFLSEKEQGELNEIARLLKEAVNANAYENDRFLRLYGDDGRWYGGSDSKVLSIDIVSQSFSAISEIADISRVKTALKSAEELIDLKHGIIKLLSPPLNQENYLGYISAYPEGVRENGGQYTHGAIWYLYALLKIGETEKAWELFKMINPAEKCKDYNSYVKYKGEPYVISADIYSEANAGRMGWSWYTGSASWCYRLILEEFFGIKLMNGNRLKITPKLPKELSGAGVEYTHPKGSFRISFLETGSYSLSVNGKATTKDYIEFSEDISLVTVTF